MSEQEYNNQMIADYLLGTLPASEVERFDELSFTDNEFAARLDSAEKDLIDAYVGGELTGIKLEKFKSNYLASPLRRDKVRFAEAFHEFAEHGHARTKLEKKTTASEPDRTTGFFSSLNIFDNSAWRWAFAALVLAFIVGGFLIVRRQFNQSANDFTASQETPAPAIAPELNENTDAETAVVEQPSAANGNTLLNSNTELSKKTSTPQTSLTPKPEKTITPLKPLIASFFLTPPLRGAGGLQNISFSKETSVIKITLKLEGNDYKNYSAALTDESGKKLWQSGRLRSKNEAVVVTFPAKLLKPQVYSLAVYGIDSDNTAENISNYPFRAVLR